MVNIRYKTVDSTWIYVNSFDKILDEAVELDCSDNNFKNYLN
jgi:hypothetical protein